MCGIVGWISFDRDLTTARPVLEAMTATMSCRGPDASGTWTDRHAALGHHRLAVIDPPGGVQPMTAQTPGGPVTLTYSGETYNFLELREELRLRGRVFGTSSDTEVVLQGYLEWGADLASRLNGMFAFAVWDARTRQLFMVRDRLGVKPLYYYPTADGVLFGSEPKAILANPLARRIVDADGLRKLVAYALTLPDAVWAGMREVMPGTVVVVDRNGVHVRTYWKLTTREHTDDRQRTVAHVRELLEDIVRRQMIADVPVCVLLSGGLDSSTLAALCATHLPQQEKTQTVAVDFVGHAENFVGDYERAAPDAPFVHEMAARIGAWHTDLVFDHASVADPAVRQKVVGAYDLPPGSGDRDRSLYLLFRTIREQSTVALSGESADEVFGGYSWFHDPAVWQAEMFPWITAGFAKYGPPPEVFVPGLASALDLQSYLADQYATAAAEVEQLEGADRRERRVRLMSYLSLSRHLRVLLDRKDRLSMAVGLEVRVPYCDHRLVEYVYNTPWSLKTFDGREKSLLRAAVRDLLPTSVLDRVKTAYPSIQDPRYVEVLQQQADELIVAPNHPVFDLVSRSWLRAVAERNPATMAPRARNSLEWVLNLATWLAVYRPEMCVP